MIHVDLIAYTPEPAWVIEQAASVCYNSTPSRECKLPWLCYSSGHTSVLEHASFTFKVSGISRACSHQLVRHRMASFSQRSQRCVDEDGFDYIEPSTASDTSQFSHQQYESAMRQAKHFYQSIKQAIPQEDARYVLPNACCTVLCVTMNLRSLINLMNERLCSRAQWEIRCVAQQMRRLVSAVMPQAENMLVPKCEKNAQFPFCPERSSCGRHKKLSEVYRSDIAKSGERRREDKVV